MCSIPCVLKAKLPHYKGRWIFDKFFIFCIDLLLQTHVILLYKRHSFAIHSHGPSFPFNSHQRETHYCSCCAGSQGFAFLPLHLGELRLNRDCCSRSNIPAGWDSWARGQSHLMGLDLLCATEAIICCWLRSAGAQHPSTVWSRLGRMVGWRVSAVQVFPSLSLVLSVPCRLLGENDIALLMLRRWSGAEAAPP